MKTKPNPLLTKAAIVASRPIDDVFLRECVSKCISLGLFDQSPELIDPPCELHEKWLHEYYPKQQWFYRNVGVLQKNERGDKKKSRAQNLVVFFEDMLTLSYSSPAYVAAVICLRNGKGEVRDVDVCCISGGRIYTLGEVVDAKNHLQGTL